MEGRRGGKKERRRGGGRKERKTLERKYIEGDYEGKGEESRDWK